MSDDDESSTDSEADLALGTQISDDDEPRSFATRKLRAADPERQARKHAVLRSVCETQLGDMQAARAQEKAERRELKRAEKGTLARILCTKPHVRAHPPIGKAESTEICLFLTCALATIKY